MSTRESIEATCPECRGPLSLVKTDELVEVSCLVGHAYSLQDLLRAHAEAEERVLWSAVVALRETQIILDAIGPALGAETRDKLHFQMERRLRLAVAVEQIIGQLEPFDVNATTSSAS